MDIGDRVCTNNTNNHVLLMTSVNFTGRVIAQNASLLTSKTKIGLFWIFFDPHRNKSTHRFKYIHILRLKW